MSLKTSEISLIAKKLCFEFFMLTLNFLFSLEKVLQILNDFLYISKGKLITTLGFKNFSYININFVI